MLTTTGIKNFGLEFYDSTMMVLSGNARVGNTIMSFDGTRVSYRGLTGFGIESNVYQNTLVYLRNLDSATDMTQVRSDATSSLRALGLPEMADSSGYPISMLTFFTDGTTINLTDHKEI